jgi:ABC-type glutathione transport system ATPase component
LVTLGRNRTVLVIAHRLSTVKHADQIVVMDGGRVAEVGGHEQLLRNPNSTYARMWDMQTSSLASRSPLGSGVMTLLSPTEQREGSPAAHNPMAGTKH